jgi:hypothetical protein
LREGAAAETDAVVARGGSVTGAGAMTGAADALVVAARGSARALAVDGALELRRGERDRLGTCERPFDRERRVSRQRER